MKTGHAQQAATVYRAADGRKVSAAELKDERNAGARAEEEKDRANRLWMMGRVQAREVAERKKIEAGSVTRTADDQDMNDMLRDRQRWGDPGSMMGLMEKGRALYEGTYAPNRYGIVPGFRWDGVDRSNGFEKRLFVIRNEQESAREAAYKWRSEDM
ncbi:hypothetical protein BC828DRAFT_351760 [Blastocladiella britannica]|nr:hypothetical protein BC828DRAFT_351760 [Blastocladiella britannica]